MEDRAEQRFLYQLMDALMRAMESRDEYTISHQNAVAELSRLLAQELQLSSLEVEGIRVAGQLHDIGKIAIPSDLLTKVGRLHDEEYALIQTHVARGVEILDNIDFPWPVITMIGQHHERLDGSGYPKGLEGDEVCCGARILAVADTANAVVNSRPYREAQGMEAVLSIFQEDNNTAYDADVVAAFHRLVQRKGEQFFAEL